MQVFAGLCIRFRYPVGHSNGPKLSKNGRKRSAKRCRVTIYENENNSEQVFYLANDSQIFDIGFKEAESPLFWPKKDRFRGNLLTKLGSEMHARFFGGRGGPSLRVKAVRAVGETGRASGRKHPAQRPGALAKVSLATDEAAGDRLRESVAGPYSAAFSEDARRKPSRFERIDTNASAPAGNMPCVRDFAAVNGYNNKWCPNEEARFHDSLERTSHG